MPVQILDPNLLAGWEPHTPLEDSLLRRFLMNWIDSIEAHALPAGGRTLRRDDMAATDIGRPSLGGNVGTLLAPLFPDGVDEIAAVLNDFYGFDGEARSGAVYMFSPWPTPDLRPHGWTLLDYQPLMLRPVGDRALPEPSGLHVEEVRDEMQLLAYEQAMVRGFEATELEGQPPGSVFPAGILHDDRLRMWVGWADGRPVSAAAAFVGSGVANVILVGTVPEARRRGYGAALTWRATLADAALPAMLLATSEGRPVYERMGFLPLFRFAVWYRDRP